MRFCPQILRSYKQYRPVCSGTLVFWVAVQWHCIFTNGLEQRLTVEAGAAIRVVSTVCCSVINVWSVSSPLAPNGACGNHGLIHIHKLSPHLLFIVLYCFSLSHIAFNSKRRCWECFLLDRVYLSGFWKWMNWLLALILGVDLFLFSNKE